MGDLKSQLLKQKFENFGDDKILSLTEHILRERDLDIYARSVLFSHEKNASFTCASSYSKENGEILFSLRDLESIKMPKDVIGIDPLIYNHIATVYEVYLAVEKVFIENIGNDVKYQLLLKIKKMVEEFNKGLDRDNRRYFDIDDNDVKIYSYSHFSPKIHKISTVSPIERYVRLKAFYETVELVNGVYSNSPELKLFCQNFIDLIYNGYDRSNNMISYPLYNFFSQRSDHEAKKILKQFSWYSKDDLRTLYNASSMYSERDRVIYGMPIDLCEYNSIRKRIER